MTVCAPTFDHIIEQTLECSCGGVNQQMDLLGFVRTNETLFIGVFQRNRHQQAACAHGVFLDIYSVASGHSSCKIALW